jgi:hypothetical protein
MGTYTKNKKATAVKTTASGRLSHAEFVKKAIVSLRKDDYKGIHSVFTGFNNAFAKYFDGANPVDATTQLEKEGIIEIRPVKGGVILYLKGEAPAPRDTTAERADATLSKMGL